MVVDNKLVHHAQNDVCQVKIDFTGIIITTKLNILLVFYRAIDIIWIYLT